MHNWCGRLHERRNRLHAFAHRTRKRCTHTSHTLTRTLAHSRAARSNTQALDISLGTEGESSEQILKHVEATLRYSVRTSHPRFFDKLRVVPPCARKRRCDWQPLCWDKSGPDLMLGGGWRVNITLFPQRRAHSQMSACSLQQTYSYGHNMCPIWDVTHACGGGA